MVPAMFALRRIGPLSNLEYQQGSEARETQLVHESFGLLRREDSAAQRFGLKLGTQVSINRPIISWVNRDSRYLENLGLETSYHEYRNCSIRNYSMAMSRALSLGYGCIRVGRLTEEPLVLTHEQFLDYSQSDVRSDKNDLHIAKCSDLLITCATGIDFLYTLLGVPTVGVNLPTADARFAHHILILPKHLYVDDGFTTVELPIMALTSRDLKWSGHRPSLWKGLPVRLGENSPEEIDEAVVLALQLLGDENEHQRHRTVWQPLWAEFWMRAKDSNLDGTLIGCRPTLILPNSALLRFSSIQK
jgi:putative glycosyltransferase (TIGR04372 family)